MRVFRISLTILSVLLMLGMVGSCSKNNPASPGGTGGRELNSGNVSGSGGVYAHMFLTAGTYPYHCSIHNAMTGTVFVTNAASLSAVGLPFPLSTSGTFQPESVKVNGTVTWTNNSGTTHTVTSD